MTRSVNRLMWDQVSPAPGTWIASATRNVSLGALSTLLAVVILLPPFDIYRVQIPTVWGTLDPVRISQVVISILFASSLCHWLLVEKRTIPFVLLVLSVFATLVMSRLPIRSSTFISVNFVLPFAAVRLLAEDRHAGQWMKQMLVPLLAVLGSIDACVGIALHFNPRLLDFVPYVPWRFEMDTAYGRTGRLGGLQIHPGVLGAFMLVFSLLFLWKLLRGTRWIYLPPLLLCFAALFLSYSRSALIFFGGFFLVLTFQILRERPRLGAGMMAVGFIVMILTSGPLFSRMRALRDSRSISHRALMYGWALERLDGPGRWLFGRREDVFTTLLWKEPPADGLKVVDNIYLTIGVQYGVCGLALLLLLIIPPVVREDEELGGIRLGLLALLLEGLTFDILLWQNVTVMIAVFSAVLWEKSVLPFSWRRKILGHR